MTLLWHFSIATSAPEVKPAHFNSFLSNISVSSLVAHSSKQVPYDRDQGDKESLGRKDRGREREGEKERERGNDRVRERDREREIDRWIERE